MATSLLKVPTTPLALTPAAANKSAKTVIASPMKTIHALKSWKAKSCKPTDDLLRSRLSIDTISEPEDLDLRLEDQLTNEKLSQLEQIFQEADEDEGGGLDMDEFRIAMRKALGDTLTDHELDVMFMKVDTNCDGTVDWDEFLSYMLLEYQEKDHMNQVTQERPLPHIIRAVPHINRYQRFNDKIVKIVHMPILNKTKTYIYRAVTDQDGKYVSVTKDGVVSVWTTGLTHVKRFKIDTPKSSGLWVVDLIFMPNLNLLAIATTSATITFYELSSLAVVKVITELEIAVTCMDYWVDPKDSSQALLLWGDARGNISAVEFSGCPNICFMQPVFNKDYHTRVSFHDLQKDCFCGVKAYKLPKLHDDFVMRVKYFSAMECFISCCQSRTTSMYMGDLRQRRSAFFPVNRGVMDFDYSLANNVIVSGGKDALVRVWNPYVPSKPVMLFRGHKSSITHVIVNEQKEHIISISEDKDIFIFDLNSQTCIQSITRKWVSVGPRPISAVCFNPHRQALIIAGNQLAIFEHQDLDLQDQHLLSHQQPVKKILYNSLFNQIVSGGTDSFIGVWDLTTGVRLMQFIAHTKKTETGETETIEISDMTFDPTLRRLITAGRNGSVRIWNFNNGALLRELPRPNEAEVTSLICDRGRILTGYDNLISVYVDSVEDNSVQTWFPHHREDILTMAFLHPSLVVSASYDGDVILWSLEAGHVISSLNAHKSIRPCLSPDVTYTTTTADKQVSRPLQRVGDVSVALSQNTSYVFNKKSCCKPSSKTSNALPAVGTKQTGRTSVNTGEKGGSIEESEADRDKTPQLQKDGPSKVESGEQNAAVESLVFLKTRTSTPGVASLVAAGAEGWVRFWSVHPEGGLIGQFNAAHHPGEAITSLVTDETNEFLITGGSNGYIKVWDIVGFCQDKKSSKIARHSRHMQFAFFKASLKLRKAVIDQSKHASPPFVSNPRETWRTPVLVNSFRAHLQEVTSLEYINHEEYLVSASTDCSIRLWTVYGEYLAVFGQDTPWSAMSRLQTLYNQQTDDITKTSFQALTRSRNRVVDPNLTIAPLQNTYRERKVPSDVRRVASAATQRVFNQGPRPHWRLAKNIILIWFPMMKGSKKTSQGDVRVCESDEECARQIAVNESAILGKSYQKVRRHQNLPKLAEPRQILNQYDVYSSLPIQQLEPVDLNVTPPDSILDRHKSLVASGSKRSSPANVKSKLAKWKAASYMVRKPPVAQKCSFRT